MTSDFLHRFYMGNAVIDYLYSLAIVTAGCLAVTVFRKLVVARLKTWADRTATTFDDFLIDLFRRTVIPLAYFGVFYVGFKSLRMSPGLARLIDGTGLFALTVASIHVTIALIKYGVESYFENKEGDTARGRAVKGFLSIINVVVWGLGSVFLLDNLGFKISTVIAGLGIGGIAVALAAQSMLGDLFSYVVILFDRPFEIGDFIVVGDCSGTVEYIGIRTTRIAGLGGEKIILANKDLTGSRVRNFKGMESRRNVFKFGVTYQTPLPQLREIPGAVTAIMRSVEGATVDRVHFHSYGDFSLVFEAVYFVAGSDYGRYMDIQQEINFRIGEEFERRGIAFAYPTQTVYLARSTAS